MTVERETAIVPHGASRGGMRKHHAAVHGRPESEAQFRSRIERAELDARQSAPPPHDLEAEKAVLGAVLLDAGVLPMIEPIVSPADFYHPAHAIIFNAMLTVAGAHKPIDVVTVNDELRAMDRSNAVGGLAYLGELVECTPTTAHAEQHARIVADHRQARDHLTFARELEHEVLRGRSIDKLASLVSTFATTGMQLRARTAPVSLSAIANGEYERIVNDTQVASAISSGFEDVDRCIGGGYEAGQLIVIAARPAMGKSAYAAGQAYTFSKNTRRPSLFFAFEMMRVELIRRLICADCGVSPAMQRDYWTMDDATMAAYNDGSSRVASVPLFIEDNSDLTLAELRASALRFKAQHPDLGLVVVDYLQLMKASHTPMDSREREISTISRGLKQLAKELSVPVIALSQLNRSVESRADKRPMLSDLRESGAIEQDANIVHFIYRDEVYNKDTQDKGVAEIITAKARSAPGGTARLRWVGERTWFSAFDEQDPQRFAVPYNPPARGHKRKERRDDGRGGYPAHGAFDGAIDGTDENGVPY